MFELTVTSIPDAEAQMLESLSQGELAGLHASLALPATPAPHEAPFCQLSYNEIPMPFVDQLFSYANIAKTNGPIGLAGKFEPFSRPPELVVFPLPGLLNHLRATVPEHLASLASQGEPERFLAREGASYGSAQEFLVAGTLACIHFASRFRCAFVIRW